MSKPIPSPQSLAQRRITALSSKIFLDETGKPCRLDPASPQTFESVLSAVLGMADYETRLWQQDDFKELLPTTATEKGLLPQHGEIWSVPRRGATYASGYILISATQDVTIPEGVLVTADGTVQWRTGADLKLYAYVPASVHVQCVKSGVAGNLAPNVALTLVNPIAGISKIVSDDDGFSGGAEIEDVESWRSRIIKNIRRFYGGGTKMDYEDWAAEWGASFYKCVPSYWGAGTVGVIFAMENGKVPTEEQVQSLTDYLNDGRRPVRGNMRVYPAKIVPQIITVSLNPDTDTQRQALVAALQPLILSVGIGGTLYRSALENALFNLSGVKSKLISPVDDVVFAQDEMPILDHVEFEVLS